VQGDAEAGATTVIFLHASPSLPSVRLCWDGAANHLVGLPPFPANNEMPASNYAGIPVGGAVWLDDAQGQGMLGGKVYAVRAKLLAELPPATCDQLICPPGGQNCLVPNAEYWPVGILGSLLTGATNVVAIEGCLGADDPLATLERCGPTWNAATGNLHLEVVQIPASAPDDGGGLLVQAAQLSPGLQALVGDAGVTTTISFGPQDDAQAPIAQFTREGDLLPSAPASIALPAGLSTFGQLGFAVDVGAQASTAGHLWMSLAQAQQLVSPAENPAAYYGAGGTYVVAVLGDPGAPHAFAMDADGGYDGEGCTCSCCPPCTLRRDAAH
jgi:hypothetical protein